MSTRSPIDPLTLAVAALAQPVATLAIAALATGAIVLLARMRREGRARRTTHLAPEAAGVVAARHRPERVALAIAAVAVIAALVTEDLAGASRSYDTVSWWRYVVPIGVAALGLAVVLGVIAVRGTRAPEEPMLTAERRTWMSFGPRAGLAVAGVALLALIATTVGAGAASSPDGDGRHVWLEIPIPNEPSIDPIRVWFYGWAYGVPVLIGAVVLVGLLLACLRSNAARPYIRPETVAAEREGRRVLASGAVRIATAGMLLALAGAWRLIGSAGSLSGLVVEGANGGAPYDATWRRAELAVAAGWGAPLVEIAAFVLLLLVAGAAFGRASGEAAPDEAAAVAPAGATR